jgi:hypothetical protein
MAAWQRQQKYIALVRRQSKESVMSRFTSGLKARHSSRSPSHGLAQAI